MVGERCVSRRCLAQQIAAADRSSSSSILEIDTPTSLIGSHQQQSTSILAIVAMTTTQTGKQAGPAPAVAAVASSDLTVSMELDPCKRANVPQRAVLLMTAPT